MVKFETESGVVVQRSGSQALLRSCEDAYAAIPTAQEVRATTISSAALLIC